MRLTGSVTVLGCQQLEQCLEFYQSALQFVILRQRHSKQGIEWVYLVSGSVFLMLEKRTEAPSNPSTDSRLYLYTDNIVQLHHYLQARGLEPGALRTTDYATQEFDLVDPDGHCLSIGEKDPL